MEILKTNVLLFNELLFECKSLRMPQLQVICKEVVKKYIINHGISLGLLSFFRFG